MRCPACDVSNPDGQRFCSACGAALYACEHCGFDNEPYAGVCGGCGRMLPLPLPDAARQQDSSTESAARAFSHRELERRQMTVLFCDLVDSTALAAALDPEDLQELTAAYQATATATLAQYQGFIARHVWWDGIFAYFGYPQAREDDAPRALRAGLALVEAMRQLQLQPPLNIKVRVAIATGTVLVGDEIKEGTILEGAAVSGIAANLAARLRTLAEPGTVLISASTRKLVGDRFDCVDLGRHLLKGFDAPVEAWRVQAERPIESRFEAIHRLTELSPFADREQERQVLQQRWAQAALGAPQVVTVRGEAGIGKSRLAQGLREIVIGQDHGMLRLYCAPQFQNTALFPAIDQLQRLAGFERDDPADAKLAKLERLLASLHSASDVVAALPYLAALLSIPTGDRFPAIAGSPERQKERLLDILAESIVALARRRPLLFLLEDAHWIDPTSLALLQLFIAKVAGLPALLLVTARPEFEPPWASEPFALTLELGRLDKGSSRQIVEAISRDNALPPALLTQILDKSDGVPLFVEELTKTVVESRIGQEGPHAATSLQAPLAVPSTLQDSLMARLDRLGSVKEVAQIGAAIGRLFAFELLVAVSELPAQYLRAALDRLIGADLVHYHAGASTMTCSFKHALVRDAAYATLLRGKRQKLHARIAEVLEKSFPGSAATEPELLAHHLTQAAMPLRAIPYWQKAGIRAASRAAHVEAAGHYQAAIDLLARLPDAGTHAPLELALRTQLGLSLSASRGYAAPEVQGAYARARELCDVLGNTAELFPVLRGLWAFYVVRDELASARDLAEQCVRIGEETQRPDYLIEGHTALGYVLVYLGRFAEGRMSLEKAVEIYLSHGGNLLEYPTPQDPAVACLSLLAIVAWAQGDRPNGSRYSREALAAAAQLNRPFDLAFARCFAAMFENIRREPAAAAHHAEIAVQISSEHGFDVWLSAGTMHLALAKGALGQRSEAIGTLTFMLAAWHAGGAELNRSFFLAGLAEISGAEGRIEDAFARIEEAIEHAGSHREHFYMAMLHRVRGELLQAAKGAEAAEAALRQAVDVARGQRAKGFELLALQSLCDVSAKIGQPERERGALQALRDELAAGDALPGAREEGAS